MFHFTSNMLNFVVDHTERNLRCLWTVAETRKTNGTGPDSHTYSQGTDLLQIEGIMKEFYYQTTLASVTYRSTSNLFLYFLFSIILCSNTTKQELYCWPLMVLYIRFHTQYRE